MQTYEIAPDEPMETLVRSLSRLARRDKDITLVVPAGINSFTPDNVQKLSGVLRSYDARMRVQAADPAVVKLFQQAGFPAEQAAPGPPIAGDLSEGDGPPGLDVTLPDWLRDVAPEPQQPGNRVVGRAPASNLDVTMPSWLGDTQGGAPAPAMGAMGDMGLPDWLREDAGVGGGGTGASDLPDWLRAEPFASPAPTAPPAADPRGGPLPSWGGPTSAGAGSAPPPPAPAAPPMAAAPPPPVPEPDRAAGGGNLSALAGPPQTAESLGQAVRAAGLDLRTRSLLLFGMALVRLAPAEAAGAAAAARQAGCSDDELRLVVEMAQALGGGPSERLGRKILGG